ncbi:DUF58 domain-containing protein [candidate division WOR-3 bacterium]|nr:DUF58 domain-containing protein [candidate division WOR-3 bacterium]
MELLQPEIIEKIGALNLRARLVVEGFITGLHQSPFYGFSLEFHEHRSYYPGDPISRIDWKLYGRTDRYYLRKYQAETNLTAYLLVDKSKSMNYGKGITKFHYARTLAASLAYLLLHQCDSVGLVLFDQKIRSFIPPKSRLTHLNLILKDLTNSEPSYKTSLSDVLFNLAPTMKRRSLIIVLSDLLDDQEEVINAFRLIKVRKNEIIVFHILDSDELEFDFNEQALFRDMEDYTTIPVNPVNIKDLYHKRFNRFLEQYKTDFASHRIDYSVVTTTTPYYRALSSYLSKRKRLL